MSRKRLMIASLLVVVLTSAFSAVLVPMTMAGRPLAVETEVSAVMGAIDTASRLYQVEHSEPPPDLNAIISKGYLDRSNLDGSFRYEDYDFAAFGDLGTGRNGVLKATARNPETDLSCEIRWNPELEKYEISTHGDPRDTPLLKEQLVIVAAIAVIFSLVVFPVSLIVSVHTF